MSRSIMLAAAAVALLTTEAMSHESWINAGRYRSPADGTLCCGEHDCAVVPVESIRTTPQGYRLVDGELIPYAEALTSEDGQYYRCRKPDGSRRCFFAPLPGS